MIKIESLNNKLIKLVSSLKMKKSRDKEGLFFAEGERNVLDALKKTGCETCSIEARTDDFKTDIADALAILKTLI